MDSKELFDKIKNVKLGRKTLEKKRIITNLENSYKSREEVFNFFRDFTKMMLDSSYKAKEDETSGKGLKRVTRKQILQRLPIALAQIKAGITQKVY